MVKQPSYIDTSETLNWNVAKSYAHLKILKPLLDIDDFETVAMFGTSELVDEFVITPELRDQARVKAITRMVKALQRLIDNSVFAVKKDDKELLKNYHEDLVKIEKILPTLYRTVINHRTKKKEVQINDDKFQMVLNILQRIKRELNDPLNRADLIFSSDDSIDPDELKERMIQDMIHSG